MGYTAEHFHAALLHPAQTLNHPSKDRFAQKLTRIPAPAPAGATLRWRLPANSARPTPPVNTLGFSRRFHVFAAPKQDAGAYLNHWLAPSATSVVDPTLSNMDTALSEVLVFNSSD